jgi:hypothetical protein
MTARSMGSPYGPMTPSVRAFLVRFAGLGHEDRARVTATFDLQCTSRAWQVADRALGEVIEQSGRTDERDALAGPLLQLVLASDPPVEVDLEADVDEEAVLDPVAEPALAALMALLVRDLLSPHHFTTLYAPFADTIPAPDGRE